MNTADLEDEMLDYWTARAEGFDAEVVQLYGWRYCRIDAYGVGWRVYEPNGSASLAGDIMRRRRYTVFLFDDADADGVKRAVWRAEARQNPIFHGLHRAESPWVAVCRLRVDEVFGSIVADEEW